MSRSRIEFVKSSPDIIYSVLIDKRDRYILDFTRKRIVILRLYRMIWLLEFIENKNYEEYRRSFIEFAMRFSIRQNYEERHSPMIDDRQNDRLILCKSIY